MEAARDVPGLVSRCGRGNAYTVDQLKRAIASAVLNLVEGNGRTSNKERARFFDIAIASIAEAQAAVELLEAFGAVSRKETASISEHLRVGYAMVINLKRSISHPKS